MVKDGPLQEIAETSSLDFAALFGAVGHFAGQAKQQAPGFSDQLLRAEWVWVAVKAESAAGVLLDRNASTSLTALTSFVQAAEIAMSNCAS